MNLLIYMPDKKDLIKEHIKRNISLSQDRFRHLLYDSNNKLYAQRFAFKRFENHINDFLNNVVGSRWIIMPGLRGTGKTTLTAQIYSRLIRKGIPSQNILYISLDDVVRIIGANLNDIVSGYEDYLGKKIESFDRTESYFLFIDEAHYDSNWAIVQKSIYDKTDRIFMLTTGSSSLSLQSNADTVRRARFEKLFPLSFIEYIMLKKSIYPIKNLKNDIETALFFSDKGIDAFSKMKKAKKSSVPYYARIKPYDIEEYLRIGTLPVSIEQKNEREFYSLVMNILNRIVHDDISALKKFDTDTQIRIMNLLTRFALSNKINYSTLSRDTGLSKPTIIDIIKSLEKCEVLYPVRPFASPTAKIRKTPRYHFLASTIRASLLSKVGLDIKTPTIYGALFEDVVALYLYKLKESNKILDFNFDASEGGADFIIILNDSSKIILEAGFGSKGINQIEKTKKKVKAKYSLLISDSDLNLTKDKTILYVPKELFLLC